MKAKIQTLIHCNSSSMWRGDFTPSLRESSFSVLSISSLTDVVSFFSFFTNFRALSSPFFPLVTYKSRHPVIPPSSNVNQGTDLLTIQAPNVFIAITDCKHWSCVLTNASCGRWVISYIGSVQNNNVFDISSMTILEELSQSPVPSTLYCHILPVPCSPVPPVPPPVPPPCPAHLCPLCPPRTPAVPHSPVPRARCTAVWWRPVGRSACRGSRPVSCRPPADPSWSRTPPPPWSHSSSCRTSANTRTSRSDAEPISVSAMLKTYYVLKMYYKP